VEEYVWADYGLTLPGILSFTTSFKGGSLPENALILM
jgi:hypothetical protein